ncbi:hypothetical protein DW839_01975 [Enterocloster bolteae]|jgi:hypothetical protein|uniref:Uncharacterized protein n=1 Tax=Enterocloster bolteae TaxID=208479 RepID=A0A414B080_9FIRM|nr:hypothetical protein DW839_01975 [Enterocloster bolteae]
MTRGTTPTITLTLNEVDLTSLKSVYVTFCQSGKMLTKQSGTEGVEITEHTVSVSLSQEETLRFTPGTVEVQLRGLTNGGDAFATNVARVAVKEVLLKEVIT